MSKKGFGHKDNRKLTGAGRKESSKAWHTARDDAVKSGNLKRGGGDGGGGGKFSRTDKSGRAAMSLWERIFGK